MEIGINEFVKRQTPESKFSHFDGSWEELEAFLRDDSNNLGGQTGYRAGVYLLRVKPEQFMSPVIKVDGDTKLEATFGSRRDDEQSHLGIVAKGEAKQPAKFVEVVLYHRETLMEDPKEKPGPEKWQVISINASPTEEEVPFAPIARARNILGLEGGTDAKLEEKSAEELIELVRDMARATIFHSQHVMVEPLQAETVRVGDRYEITTDGKGGAELDHGDDNGRQNSGDPLFDELHHAGMTGMETLLADLAKSGVKVGGPRFREAVENAVTAIGVHSYVQRKHSRNAPK